MLCCVVVGNFDELRQSPEEPPCFNKKGLRTVLTGLCCSWFDPAENPDDAHRVKLNRFVSHDCFETKTFLY